MKLLEWFFQWSPGLGPNRAGGEQEVASSPGSPGRCFSASPALLGDSVSSCTRAEPSPVPGAVRCFFPRPGACRAPALPAQGTLGTRVTRRVLAPGHVLVATCPGRASPSPAPWCRRTPGPGCARGAAGGSKEGDKRASAPALGAGPKAGFSGVSLLSLSGGSLSLQRWGPGEGGQEARASAASCRHRPPVPGAKEPPPAPQPPPGQHRPARTPRSPTGTRSVFIVRVGTSCLPGPRAAPTDPAPAPPGPPEHIVKHRMARDTRDIAGPP